MQLFKKSKWLWINKENNKDEYAEFFTSFNADSSLAICHISCDGDYTLFINGKTIESNQYGDFEHYKIYDEIDISSFIKQGKNTLAILVWHFGEDSQRYKLATPGLIFEVIQDEKILVSSDESIFARKSKAYLSYHCKKITNQLGYSFYYDANKEDEWIKDGFAGDFAISSNKTCQFYKRPINKLKRDRLKEAKILINKGNYYLLDLGEETVGLPSFSFTSNISQKMVVFWGEDLINNHVRGIIEERNFSFEYIAKPGKNEFTNYMLRLGGRYLEIYLEKDINLEYFGLIPQTYPVLEKPFTLADPVEEKIYKLCVRTLKLCLMEHYVDTPWREQCLYAFDSRNQMLSGYFAFEDGNKEYAKSNLLLLSKDCRTDNLLSICAPSGIDLTIPSFSLYFFLSSKEYLKHTGDTSLIKEIYPKLSSLIKVFINNMKEGLVYNFEGKNHWNFYDWSTYLEGNLFGNEEYKPDLVINCLFVLALSSFEDLSKAINKDFIYSDLLEKTRKRIATSFYNEKEDAYSFSIGGNDFTVLGNALAILANISSNPSLLAEKLTNGTFVEPSLSMKCFKYDALLLADQNRWKDYVLNEIKRDYSLMLEKGATSVWETIEGARAFNGAGSLCHGWSAMPIYYYHLLRGNYKK